ncbi:MAG: 3-isopropylmalate dehydrogenase [Chromatiales bacterium]|nr:3-isopropylmalate dehydrogenase [Chromatiales bacterium]
MKLQIAVLAGDGIGPEVTQEACRVLQAVAKRYGHLLSLGHGLIGGAAIDAEGDALPFETIELCRNSRAILLGAVGGPKWSDPDATVRPEQGLLALRKTFGLFANLRPVKPDPHLRKYSPIKEEYLKDVDLLVVRELTGGIYFGDKLRDENSATDVCRYTVGEIERVLRLAGKLAMGRRRKLVSVDKANVLETSRLWRATAQRIYANEFPELEVEHILVDAAAMYLINRPADFDVMVTENMFGDILTDEASMLAGSLGMLPSASLGESEDGLAFGLYEPIHGSAPDIAGRGVANPYATILSTALMLRLSFGLEDEAAAIEAAVASAVKDGVLTPDLVRGSATPSSTVQAADAVLERL